jgi:hypothetical protein
VINKELFGWLIGIGGGFVLIVWGIHGILNKNIIKSRSNYILSIGQLIGGIMALIFPLIYLWYWHGK